MSSLIIPTEIHSHLRTILTDGGHTAPSPINTLHFLTNKELQKGLINAAEQELEECYNTINHIQLTTDNPIVTTNNAAYKHQ